MRAVHRSLVLELLLFLLIAAVAEVSTAHAQPPIPPGLRRFALVVGANDGGPGRVKLRFAGSDARSFSRVLRDLGGASPDDVEVLVEPTLADVRAGFTRLATRMAAARSTGGRVELIVYYSGHSDEQGLLFSGVKLTYDDLRRQISSMPADVQIAILDSCASGAFTRTKGGKRRPAFLVDEAHRVRGHAFLSSSSVDEQAQESDRLGASFFTHAFVGGLRGAADANRDGRVTLQEAYYFAYSETVSGTQNTRFGTQHPNYDMHLTGTGDIVLTDLRGTGATVVLARELAGRVFVRDRAQQSLFIEFTKQSGSPRELGLPPDSYEVILDTGEERVAAHVVVRQGQRVTLVRSDFKHFALQGAVARGGPPGTVPPILDTSAMHIDLFHLPDDQDRGRHILAINLLVGGGARLDGIELGGWINMRTQGASGVQIAGIGNFNDGEAGLQIAGIVNWAAGPADIGQISGIMNWSAGAKAFQIAGIGNVARGPSPGLQIAGITNLQRDGDAGLQVAGILNWTERSPRMGQIAGVSSWSGADVEGFQVSGIASVASGSMRGLQIGGVTNQVRGDMRGMQIGGVYNHTSGDVSGVQLAVLNIGGAVDGAQIGVVNVARRIDGLQLGLVNVATESNAAGAPIGLLSVAPDGRRSIEAWVADIIPARLGLKLGSQRLYTLLAIAASTNYLAAGAGLGVHVPARSFYIDIDLGFYEVRDQNLDEAKRVDAMTEARAMVGVPLDLGFSVFAGLSANGIMSWNGDEPARDDLGVFRQFRTGSIDSGDFSMEISPGFFAGLSY
jgi:hypothetical protein